MISTSGNLKFSTSTPNSLQIPIDVASFRFCFSTPYQLPFAVPFLLSPATPRSDGARLQLGIWWKKGSFLLFWISCFCRLPGEGVGWLHHSPLSRTGLTTLMWPRFTPLSCLTLSALCGVTFDVPFPLEILFLCTLVMHFLGTEQA